MELLLQQHAGGDESSTKALPETHLRRLMCGDSVRPSGATGRRHGKWVPAPDFSTVHARLDHVPTFM
jgi:hypothetical protein